MKKDKSNDKDENVGLIKLLKMAKGLNLSKESMQIGKLKSEYSFKMQCQIHIKICGDEAHQKLINEFQKELKNA